MARCFVAVLSRICELNSQLGNVGVDGRLILAKFNVTEVCCEGVDWAYLAQDTIQWSI